LYSSCEGIFTYVIISQSSSELGRDDIDESTNSDVSTSCGVSYGGELVPFSRGRT
jgi:hypothetical protein